MAVEFKGITRFFKDGSFTLFQGLCKGCGLCIAKCPGQALSWSEVSGEYGTPVIEPDNSCTVCGICEMVCPDCAITVKRKEG